jgi:uncharacterized membrane-anchored protein
VYYAAKGLLPQGSTWSPEKVTAVSIPIALLIVGFGLYRFRRSLHD